jgi:hypothetical protein
MQRTLCPLQQAVCSTADGAVTMFDMKFNATALYVGACALLSAAIFNTVAFGDAASAQASAAQYTPEGLMQLPKDYRDWVFLSSGMDMSYSAGGMDHHMFDNVFVNPDAYKVFVSTGTWPDGAVLLTEVRRGTGKGSINKSGTFQTTEIMGVEVHVKDSKRFAGSWAFFAFDGDQPAKMIPQSAGCYSCHAAHAAVDNTFVQFYPTLLPIAQSKGTLSAAYKKDVAAE